MSTDVDACFELLYNRRSMPEGELPEIPQHLVDAVISTEAFDQRERRAHQMRLLAQNHLIPQRSLETNAMVNRYVGVARDAWAAAAALGEHDPLYMPNVFAEGSYAHVRAEQARRAYEVETDVLLGDFPDRTGPSEGINAWSFRLNLGAVVKPLGLTVKGFKEFAARERGSATVIRNAGPLWNTGRPEPSVKDPWERSDGLSYRWSHPDGQFERHDRDHLGRLAQEAVRQGLPSGAESDALTHTLLTGIIKARDLVAATTDFTGLPDAPGVAPSAQDRLQHVSPLNRAALALLEDAVHPRGRHAVDQLAATLTPFLATYGLKIVEEPPR